MRVGQRVSIEGDGVGVVCWTFTNDPHAGAGARVALPAGAQRVREQNHYTP